MIIHITQEHIDKGGTTAFNCPMVLALREHFQVQVEIAVAWGYTSGDIDNKRYFLTDVSDINRLSKFILDFDQGEKVEPTSFEIYEIERSN